MIQNKFRYLGKAEIDDTKMGCILFVYDITYHICGNIDMYNIEYFIGTSSGVSVLWYSSITFLILVVTYTTVFSSIHLRIGCVLPLENPFPNEKSEQNISGRRCRLPFGCKLSVKWWHLLSLSSDALALNIIVWTIHTYVVLPVECATGSATGTYAMYESVLTFVFSSMQHLFSEQMLFCHLHRKEVRVPAGTCRL